MSVSLSNVRLFKNPALLGSINLHDTDEITLNKMKSFIDFVFKNFKENLHHLQFLDQKFAHIKEFQEVFLTIMGYENKPT